MRLILFRSTHCTSADYMRGSPGCNLLMLFQDHPPRGGENSLRGTWHVHLNHVRGMSQGLVVHAARFSALSGHVSPLSAGDVDNVGRAASDDHRHMRLYSFYNALLAEDASCDSNEL